jgi:hypothetical protein
MVFGAQNQFSFTRAASSTASRAKSNFLSVTIKQMSSASTSDWQWPGFERNAPEKISASFRHTKDSL